MTFPPNGATYLRFPKIFVLPRCGRNYSIEVKVVFKNLKKLEDYQNQYCISKVATYTLDKLGNLFQSRFPKDGETRAAVKTKSTTDFLHSR